MTQVNGTGRKHLHPATIESEYSECPTCGQAVTKEQLDRILKVDEARRRKLDDALADIERQRQEIEERRSNIAAAAVEEERTRWKAEKARADREIEKLERRVENEHQRLEREHQKALQQEAKKRDALDKRLAKAVASAEARANAEAEARVRAAVRAATEQRRAVVDDLRERVRTVEGRRRRDEEHLQKTISELKKKLEDRDRSHLGPEAEESLMDVLRGQFHEDHLEHRGQAGDILHRVIDRGRQVALIVYEIKNRATWSKDYLRQLRHDLERHGSSHGVLVTRAMPAGKSAGVALMGDVIVVVPALAAPVVSILRDGLVRISRLKASESEKEEKKAELYDFLRGDEFAGPMSRILAKIEELREEISRQKSSHEGSWRRQEDAHSAIFRAAAAITSRIQELLGRREDRAGDVREEEEHHPRAKALRRSTKIEPGDVDLTDLLQASVDRAGGR